MNNSSLLLREALPTSTTIYQVLASTACVTTRRLPLNRITYYTHICNGSGPVDRKRVTRRARDRPARRRTVSDYSERRRPLAGVASAVCRSNCVVDGHTDSVFSENYVKTKGYPNYVC